MEFKPLSGREHPRFGSIKTFFRYPFAPLSEAYDIALVGVPFDGGVSYRPGARFAPTKIREMSSLGRSYHWGREVDVSNKIKIADVGDCPVVPIDLPQTYKKIETYFAELLSLGKRFIAFGGDHSTTLPILRAAKKHYGKPVTLVHFDAHLDTYPAAWDCEYHHGAFVRHAILEGLVEGSKVYQFGIRGPLASEQDLEFVNKHGVQVFTIDHIRENSIAHFSQQLPRFSKDELVYISFDIDCFDPAYAPGTGTPVPGGLTSYEAQKILRSLQIPKLIGCDVVEVNPAYDPTEITSLLAVDMAFEMLALYAKADS